MRPDLPEAFCSRMRAQLGGAFDAYLLAMERTPKRALRVNTQKISAESFRDLVDFPTFPIVNEANIELSSTYSEDISITTPINTQESALKVEKSSRVMDDIPDISINSEQIIVKSSEYRDDNPISEFQNSFFFPDDVAIGRHIAHIAGLCYVQEPSAQAPAALLDVQEGMTVLDLCAAPGGKSGQLAARLMDTGCLIANEPVPSRAEVLVGNLERLGVGNAVVTCLYPDALSQKLAGRCDAVLVDAPCSGEGMFRRDAGAVADWSEGHVRACAERQRAILDCADRALKPGGTLVYSTCTFSSEENEETVAAFLDAHPYYALVCTRRMYPHDSAGEGQFMAKLLKQPDAPRAERPEAPPRPKGRRGEPVKRTARVPEWEAFCAAFLMEPPARLALLLSDGRVVLPPEAYYDLPEGLRVLRAGILAGEIVKGRFIPAHALAQALHKDAFRQTVPLNGDALAAYLAGESVPCDRALSGWCAVTALGYPIGWGKAVQGTLKNHLPKGLRVR